MNVSKIIVAVIVAVAVALVCILVGTLLGAIEQDVARAVGQFLKTYSTLIGFLSGLWYYFTGERPTLR